MAEDSQESVSVQEPGSHLPASNPSTDPKKPKHEFPQSQVGKLWDAFGNPDEPLNALANASYKPPGKRAQDVPYSEVIGSFSASDLSTFHKAPCARESLLTGIGAGFGIGGIRGVFGGRMSRKEKEIWKSQLTLIPRDAFIMVGWQLGRWNIRYYLTCIL